MRIITNIHSSSQTSFGSLYLKLPVKSINLRMARIYPKVWSKFERESRDGRPVHFQIEDVSEDMWSTVVEFMLGNYIREDVWWVAAGTSKDSLAIKEYRILLESFVRQKMSLACFLTDGDGSGRTLVGTNLCVLQKKGHFVEHVPPKSQPGLLSLRMFVEAMKENAVYDKYEVDEYLMGVGLLVAPEYRRLGIATEMLKTRITLAKELNIKLTGGIFTGTVSQRAAEKAGMECYYQISYKDFGKQCEITFDTTTEHLKMYAAHVD